MSVSLTFPYDYFDPDKKYTWNQRLGIIILDWDDINSNGNVETDEVWQINYGYDYGTSNEVKVGFPRLKFRHTPIILVYQRTNTEASLEYIPFKLYIRFYERTTWNWIELSQTNLTVAPDDVTTFNATLTVSPDAPQGVYEGQLIIMIDNRKLAVPISVNVPTLIPAGELVYNIDTQEYEGLYNPFAVEGYFDWGWRYEAGDWKNWLFEFDNPSTIAAFIQADWEGNMSDVDMFAIHPLGMIMDGTGDHWSGTDGIFFWNTRTGSTEEYVTMYTGQLPFVPPSITIPKIYTVLLHNVLFDGTLFPENLSCNVKMINLDPASPADLIIRPGESKSLTFTLSTGIKLTNIGLYPSAPFPIDVNPMSIAEIPEMGSQTFNVTVQVPADAPTGKYLATVYLVASEFPSGMSLPIYIYVDVPIVKLVDVKIDVGKIHFPSEFAQLYIMTTLNASFVDTMDGIQTTLWYRTTSGSYLSLDLGSEIDPISLGLYTVEFEVPVDATSCCLVVQIAKYVEDDNILYTGVSMASFDISSTLNNWNAYLQGLIGDVAIIKTDVGMIKANVTSINATLSGLMMNSKDELIAAISTTLGILQADLDNLNATLLSINETTVEIKTRLGNIETSLETIELKVEWIEGNVTIIRTSLGDIMGAIETIDDNVATIKTDLGQIKVNVEDIEGYTANTSQTTAQNLLGTWAAIGLSLIAAICSSVVLILIRKKPKP